MKNTGVILASFIGTATIFGILALRNILKKKNYHADYNDHHKLFDKPTEKHYFGYGDSIEINAYL